MVKKPRREGTGVLTQNDRPFVQPLRVCFSLWKFYCKGWVSLACSVRVENLHQLNRNRKLVVFLHCKGTNYENTL